MNDDSERDRPVFLPSLIDDGVLKIRNWMGAHWGAITQDGAEPEIRALVKDLLSLAHNREVLDR